MNKLEEFDYINKLLSLYESLLTKTQQDIMKQYYAYNLSLSEISDNKGISRTAVLDCLHKSIAKLKDYENKLQLLKTKDKLLSKIEDIKKDLSIAKIEELERMIDNGI